jgi:hypothetical protein
MQTTLNLPDSNSPVGNIITNNKSSQTMRIYYQNINGAKCYGTWNEWYKGYEWINKNNIDAVLLSETNTNWTEINKQTALSNIKKHNKQTILNQSIENTTQTQDYLPGGSTCSIHNKLIGRKIENINDPRKLGRWCGFRLKGKEHKHLTIISVYRPTHSNDLSNNTSYSRQWKALTKTTELENCDPRKILLMDLETEVRKWQQQGDEIIIGIDANDTITSKNNDFKQFVQNNNLYSATEHIEQPATYNRGSKTIDYLLCTQNIKDTILGTGYLAFYEGGWKSDHRALFMDIDMTTIFGNLNKITPIINRTLQSSNYSQMKFFMKQLNKNNKLDQLLNKLQNLNNILEWTDTEHQSLEEIDQEFTLLLTKCEQKCRIQYQNPWSIEIEQAFLIKSYWKIYTGGKATKKKVKDILQNIINKLPSPNDIFQNNKERSPLLQLIEATKQLRKLQKEAKETREQYLQFRYKHLTTVGKKKVANAIKCIQRAERKKYTYAKLRKALNPTKQTGGLNYVIKLNPTTNTTKKIFTTDELESELLERNRTHFAQASVTPCAQKDMMEILGTDGITNTTREILRGNIPINVTPTMRLVMEEMKAKRPPLPSYMPIKDMIMGFHKWREATTTSPSGKHLGIYRTFTTLYFSDKLPNKINKPTEEQQQYLEELQRNKQLAFKALQIQHLLINLAIHHTHVYTRWKIIHNFFLEKLPGYPLLEKLRVIHIYEADWNLILKYFTAFQLNTKACIEKTVAPEQAGGRPGRSASTTAAQITILNEILRLTRQNGAILYNDAKACFDRIIENITNAVLMSEGLNEKIAKLHAITLAQAHYHLKTTHGISTRYNAHMQPSPFLGSGQGAADSMPRWGFLSDKILAAYRKHSIQNSLYTPISKLDNTTTIRAFVDDSNCVMLNLYNDRHMIIQQLRLNAKQWESLLYTIGAKLEISKCKFVIITWNFDKNGTAQLHIEKEPNQLTIIDSETNTEQNIEEISADTNYKLLGVEMSITGNFNAQIKTLKEKITKYTTMFTRTKLTTSETRTGLQGITYPAIKYGNNATTIAWNELDRLQAPLTTAVLPKLGFNQHMPRAVAYAPTYFGGVGLQRLSTEQGISHIQHLLGSIRCGSTDNTAIKGLLEAYSIVTGLIGNPLDQIQIIDYYQSPWLDTIKTFLKAINGKIILNNVNFPTLLRENDQALMSKAIKYTNNKDTLECINNCRLYLQVHTLAELSHCNGLTILDSALNGTTDTNGTPKLHNHSQSTYIWPQQIRPPPHAWNKWRAFIKTFLKTDGFELRRRMGKWYTKHYEMREWHYKYNSHTKIIHKGYNHRTQYNIVTTNRILTKFHRILTGNTTENIHHNTQPITPTNITDQLITIETSSLTANLKGTSRNISKDPYQQKIPDNIINQINTIDGPPITIIYKLQPGQVAAIQWQIRLMNTVIHSDTICTETDTHTTIIRLHFIAVLTLLTSIKWNVTNANNRRINILIINRKICKLIKAESKTFHTPSTRFKDHSEIILQIGQLLHHNKYFRIYFFDSSRIKQTHPYYPFYNTAVTTGTNPTIIPIQKYTCKDNGILIINDNVITTKLGPQMRHAYDSQDYRIYLMNKTGWTSSTIDTIDWEIIGTTVYKLPQTMWKTIVQYLHGWLPTLHHPGTKLPHRHSLCPCCKREEETNQHFVQCTEFTNAINDILIPEITEKNKQTPPALLEILRKGLQTTNNIIIDLDNNTPTDLIREQQQIGWNSLFQGKWTTQWRIEYNNITRTDRGLQWASNTLLTIWRFIYQRWKYRCDLLHLNTDFEQKREEEYIDGTIDDLMAKSDFTNPTYAQSLKEKINTVKRLPVHKKRSWIKHNSEYITRKNKIKSTMKPTHTRTGKRTLVQRHQTNPTDALLHTRSTRPVLQPTCTNTNEIQTVPHELRTTTNQTNSTDTLLHTRSTRPVLQQICTNTNEIQTVPHEFRPTTNTYRDEDYRPP